MERSVLLVQPYKTEILPHWRFEDAVASTQSSVMIYGLFGAYLKVRDFAGSDTACKFTQMGFTRTWRYGNHRGGTK